MASHSMNTGMHQRAEQQLLLQPRMLQSIEVLQIPAQDLEGWLLEAAESNEALQVTLPEPGARDTVMSDGRGSSREATDRFDEMLQNQPDRHQGLAESLLEQLDMRDQDPKSDAWLRFLVTCLDENGYLSPSDDEILALASAAGLEPDPTALGVSIGILQRLEPRGIGGRDMVESLLLQLDEAAQDYPLLCRLLEEFLDAVAHNRLPAVAKSLGIELEELGDLLSQLRNLEPRPGAELVSQSALPLRPDVVVEEDSPNKWNVRVERASLPAVSIDEGIADLAKDAESSKEVRAWARDRVERARWVVDAVAQRGETLLRVASAVFTHQLPFLEHGPGHLRPLMMSSVAEQLDLHVSTISRAVSGKYVQCPWGIYPLRHFFQIATGAGEAPARDDLCAIVRSIFEGENAFEPLSDDEVAEELARRGHQVARRTVAKYRRQLGIPSSYQRRKFA